jgi:hypothetical protein
VVLNKKTQMSYYNTTNLQGVELAESVEQTKSQSARIYKIMKRKGYNMTPVEVHAEYCEMYKPCPITSIRRSLTDMTTDGLLFKSDERALGLYGKDNFKWGVTFKEEK